MVAVNRNKNRLLRKNRMKKSIWNDSKRPVISVFKSSKHFYAQCIDQHTRKSLCGVGTTSKKFIDKNTKKQNIEKASDLGREFAEALKKNNISEVIFDRNGFQYIGRVKAFAEALREKGIVF